jgi:hypothetical protein
VIAAAAALALQSFRYERTIDAPRAAAVVEVDPDGRLYAHAERDFADVRILDADGRQVPWREAPWPASTLVRPLPVLDRGRRGAFAVARVRTSVPVDRVTLVVPDHRFVGTAVAYGSTDGRAWTKIASSQIYSVGGAVAASSTTVLLPANDFRYLELRATHVSRIDSVVVMSSSNPQLVRVPASVRADGAALVVDLGHAKTPVDELRITSTTPRYDRPFAVSVRGGVVVTGRLLRVGDPSATVVGVGVRTRFLRLTVDNGDDPPLRGLRVTAYARPRPLLVEGGHPAPLTLYYGGRVAAPVYDFARLPVQGAPALAALGPERPNPAFRLVDRRSFFARHQALVTAALAAAAGLLLAAGALALRRS